MQSGKIYWHSEYADVPELEQLPADIEDEEKYLPIPDKRELGLGKRIALDFSREFVPDDFGVVQEIFRGRGAYGKFKDLLARKGALENGMSSSGLRRNARCGSGAN